MALNESSDSDCVEAYGAVTDQSAALLCKMLLSTVEVEVVPVFSLTH